MDKTIFTIGHSTRSIKEFTELLQTHKITEVIDVRSVPGSRHIPQFNKHSLAKNLCKSGIKYQHISRLGGLRRAHKDSVNTGWERAAFRGYADYMQTLEFEKT